jgi:hypothetical protein
MAPWHPHTGDNVVGGNTGPIFAGGASYAPLITGTVRLSASARLFVRFTHASHRRHVPLSTPPFGMLLRCAARFASCLPLNLTILLISQQKHDE